MIPSNSETYRSARVRSLTEKGQEQYEETLEKYSSKLRSIGRDIDKLLQEVENEAPKDQRFLDAVTTDIKYQAALYQDTWNQLESYLEGTKTLESLNEIYSRRLIAESVFMKIKHIGALLSEMEEVKNPSTCDGQIKATEENVQASIEQKPKSTRSKKSKSSKSAGLSLSSASAILIKQQADLEAAKVRHKYMEQESELIIKKAALDANLKLLNSQRDVDEAKTRVKTIQVLLDEEEDGSEVSSISEEVTRQRTEQFVRDSCEHLQQVNLSPQVTEQEIQQVTSHQAKQTNENSHTTMNVDAPAFVPSTVNVHRNTWNTDMCNEFSKFMIKKDLLLSRLTKYDDKPDMYIAWKSSFKNVMSELNVSPAEEVDLLVKWLGPNSSNQALRIRASNTVDPSQCLQKIWSRLEDRFGCPEIVEETLKRKIASFPKLSNKDNKQLFDLADIVAEIESIMKNPSYVTVFAYYNSSSGVNPIVAKLPTHLQERWTTEATKYKLANNVPYPPFSVFSKYIHNTAKVRNDPSFIYEKVNESESAHHRNRSTTRPLQVSARKTEMKAQPSYYSSPKTPDSCPVHGTNHSLNMCRSFRAKPITERKEFLKKNGLCFHCCGPQRHLRRDCRETVKCVVCKSDKHASALHEDDHETRSKAMEAHGGEGMNNSVNTACTQVCGTIAHTSRSCAKIVLVNVYPKDRPHCSRTLYSLIDDQSNRSLASSSFFDKFMEHTPALEYVLSSCSGKFRTSGRTASDYVVESIGHEFCLTLPELIECDNIPNNRDEIPSPHVARQFQHLHDIAHKIPELQPDADIELLIGRDLIDAHHVLDHRIGVNGLPYAQKLPLGWVIIGETCLGKLHPPTSVCVSKTFILDNGRSTHFEPCESLLSVDAKSEPLFKKTSLDETIGLSIEDKRFIEVMESNFAKDSSGRWTAPLPFRSNRPPLANNREQALKRAKSFDLSLKRDPNKQQHTLEFMQKMFDNGHAEIASSVDEKTEHWYLPLFSIYHPKKPDSVRVVFDSAVKFHGSSLNDVLMKGPPLHNSLLGILLRFRTEAIAITVDVEQMFYNFYVFEGHRNYLRFIWHEGNDPSKPLIDYRMTVHVFGNTASPAIATYGLRKCVEGADLDVKNFVNDNFYVDDGITSCETTEQAVKLIKQTQRALYEGGRLRLHKIASNDKAVLEQFDTNDLASNLKNLDIGSDELPMQRSLGLSWDTSADTIKFQLSSEPRPYTRRGVLSMINSVFDPIGFAAPVVIQGKLLLREMLSSSKSVDWDDPLPESLMARWNKWVTSLTDLGTLEIPRMYCAISFNTALRREIFIFSDASKDAIGAVAYLKLSDAKSSHISFVLGKAKVAPASGHTIPRLELCAAVLAVELAETIQEQLHISLQDMQFYTDSQVILGYITNETRRFYVYVSNRVAKIRHSSNPEQWHYVPTNQNPADLATRGLEPAALQNSLWLRGPDFLKTELQPAGETFDLINAGEDREIRPEITTLKITAKPHESSISDVFLKFSEWKVLVFVICALKRKIRKKRQGGTLKDEIFALSSETEQFIVREVQKEMYGPEIQSLQGGKQLPKDSTLLPLSPVLDQHGVLRVGGRLRHCEATDNYKQPIIIPKGHHVATLLVRHFHQRVFHQGRKLTEGAIRAAGYWIVGARRLINSVIHNCVICRKLRGGFCSQRMADLPKDRLAFSPAFTFVGVDTFGPWEVVHRRTRGGLAKHKRWALLFTCLVTRGIHIELIEELSSSSFINALRRFTAIRGPVQQFRSDRGTNFVGAIQDLSILAKFTEDHTVRNYLAENGVIWVFNPPHASHMGGAWERLIGVARRILDAMLLRNHGNLTHEILSTFMAEVTAIVNARPLTTISYDPESPCLLTPSLLLTQKSSPATFPIPDFGRKDMLRSQWKHVQVLAEEFWQKWRSEYLHSLQPRKKWKSDTQNLTVGTVVLMKDNTCARNDWPIGIVKRVFPGDDGRVRKVELKVVRNGKTTTYIRPITELVVLLESQ